MLVKYNQVEEYCQEIRNDAPFVEHGIVRVTKSFVTSKLSSNIHHVMLLSAYAVKGYVVKLERYCGDLWAINQDADDKVINKAEKWMKEIETVCEELGLEVRAGVVEEG